MTWAEALAGDCEALAAAWAATAATCWAADFAAPWAFC
jgi:hypothetical protein